MNNKWKRKTEEKEHIEKNKRYVTNGKEGKLEKKNKWKRRTTRKEQQLEEKNN